MDKEARNKRQEPGTLILASGSPRRLSLLEEWGAYAVIVDPPGCDEDVEPSLTPEEVVAELAVRKGREVAARRPGQMIVAADTVVALDGVIYGKPVDEADARAMLAALSGRTHTVFTGLYVRFENGNETVSAERADVTFRVITPEMMDWYIATGEPFDKAGAYGAQGHGAALIEFIDGDETCVIGLPMKRLKALLSEVRE